MRPNLQNAPTNVLALSKEGHKYVFRFDDTSRKAMLGLFAEFAKDPELNFSWNDAAALSRKMRGSQSMQLTGASPSNHRTTGLSFGRGEPS